MSELPWVEVTVRVPCETYVHPEIVRDDLVEALGEPWADVEADVTDTSVGYMDLESTLEEEA